ncbi:MAG TPA: glycosyltransferase WbuB [Ignavibacteria bacterium]|nr:glycosyltransferase WbuB [Ignavibacteria bacterium]
MKILLYTHFFPPENGAAPMRMKYFADVLSKYDLKIIAPKPNYPRNKLIENWETKIPSQFADKIKHLPLFIPNNRLKFSRVISYFTFMLTSFFYSFFQMGNVEVVVCSSPPITTSFMAALFAKLRGKKLIVDIRDMWPQIGIELGILKNKFVIGILKRMENFILNNADKIIVTAEGDINNLLNRNYTESKIDIIYNGADTDLFQILSQEEKIIVREEYNLPINKKILIYFGSFNYGMNDLDILTESLKMLGDITGKIHFVAVGNGERKNEFITAINNALPFHSFDSMNAKDIAKLVAASDISLIPRKNIQQDTGGNIPVKCFESWACGIPTVLSSICDTDVQRIFNKCGAGKLVEAGNAKQFAEAIKELVTAKNISELGTTGRQFVVENFDRKKQSQKLIKIIKELEK